MGRYIRWQAIIAAAGIALTFAFLGFLSSSRTTVTVPDTGGVYTEALVGIPQHINPLVAQFNPVDQNLSALIFNGLTRFDGKGGLEPDLAESWQVSEDGRVYLFKLRRNIRWQDGKPFTADDVLFTVALMQDPELPAPMLYSLWHTVTAEKLGDYSLRFTLPEPFPAFADFTTVGILPRHLLGDMPARDLLNHPFNLQPVGTGPFILDEIDTEKARLSANPYYAGPRPRLSRLEFRFYPTYQAAFDAYQAGEVLGIGYIPPEDIPQAEAIESLSLYTARLSGYVIIYLNLQAPDDLPFFQETAVRQALMLGLDRQAVLDEALNGQGVVARGPIHPWSWAYNPEVSLPGYNPDQAARLLDEAGWRDTNGDGIRDRDGQPLAFTLLSSDAPERVAVAEAVSRQWASIGVEARVEATTAGLADRLNRRDFQAALAEVLLAGDPDPYPFWHLSQAKEGQNFAGWTNDEASILLEEARRVTNRGKRNDAYFEFQRIFAEEIPSLILYYPVYTFGVSREVHGVQVAPMTAPGDRFRSLPNWYMLTRRVIFSEAPFPEALTPTPAK